MDENKILTICEESEHAETEVLPELKVMAIASLAPEPYIVVKPFHISVEPNYDEFVARFDEANIGATGGTIEEAISNLKESILDEFDMLEFIPDTKLGAGMRQTKNVLLKALKRCA
ncbi:MAG: hypothetical protein WCT04_02590 [Planctomycetota bacterium]